MMGMYCWWFGCAPHEQDSRPDAPCDRCGGYVSYGDLVGDTHYHRAKSALSSLWYALTRWWPRKCAYCGARGKHRPDCDPIPF